jgi:hypothetical protein
MTGNPAYASVNAHLGYEQSRRDDLEAAMYLIVYILRGTLPWLRPSLEPVASLAQVKLTTSIDTICEECPPEFATVLRQIKNLKYDAEPDYDGYRALFRKAADRCRTIDQRETPILALRGATMIRPSSGQKVASSRSSRRATGAMEKSPEQPGPLPTLQSVAKSHMRFSRSYVRENESHSAFGYT